MSDVKDYFKLTFAILGTVIGAGFISGREVLTFFYGYNAIISATIFFVLFFLTVLILFFDQNYTNSVYFSIAKPLVYISDLVLCAGMLSALDAFYKELFPFMDNIPLFAVFTLVISNVIVSGGVEGIKSANLFLTPVIIVIALFSLIFIGNTDYSGSGVSPIKLCEYVGLNVFTSSVLFVDIGKNSKPKVKIISAITATLVLSAIIVFIIVSFGGADESVLRSDMPLKEIMCENKILNVVFSVALVFGIMTTLLSSHYPVYELVKTKRFNFLTQTALSALIFFISRLGFYNIVSYLYTAMGAIGFTYIFITCVLKAIFPLKRRKNT